MKCPNCEKEEQILDKQWIIEYKPDYYGDGRNFTKYICMLCWHWFLIR